MKLPLNCQVLGYPAVQEVRPDRLFRLGEAVIQLSVNPLYDGRAEY
jgi:hypothetical protein